MTTIDDSLGLEEKTTPECDSCRYLNFDSVIEDSDKVVIPTLLEECKNQESSYISDVQGIIDKIYNNSKGIVGIVDSKTGQYTIVDLTNQVAIEVDTDGKNLCDSIDTMKSVMDMLAKEYNTQGIPTKQFLITDSPADFCKQQTIKSGNFYNLRDLYVDKNESWTPLQ